MENKKTFGELMQTLRKGKGWTIKEFIRKLNNCISPAYITQIEAYGEIPSPTLICKIADIFNYDLEKMLTIAKTKKIERFEKSLEHRYQTAILNYKSDNPKGNEEE